MSRTFSAELTFSGKKSEDIELYLNRCKVQWLGVAFKGDTAIEDEKMAVTTTIITGLRDSAARFVRSLPKATTKDPDLLCASLVAKFPVEEEEDRELVALEKISKMAQGDLPLEQYFDVARDISYILPPEEKWNTLLARGTVLGLKDQFTRKVLLSHLELRKAEKKPMSLDDVVNLATDMENEDALDKFIEKSFLDADALRELCERSPGHRMLYLRYFRSSNGKAVPRTLDILFESKEPGLLRACAATLKSTIGEKDWPGQYCRWKWRHTFTSTGNQRTRAPAATPMPVAIHAPMKRKGRSRTSSSSPKPAEKKARISESPERHNIARASRRRVVIQVTKKKSSSANPRETIGTVGEEPLTEETPANDPVNQPETMEANSEAIAALSAAIKDMAKSIIDTIQTQLQIITALRKDLDEASEERTNNQAIIKRLEGKNKEQGELLAAVVSTLMGKGPLTSLERDT